MSPAVVVRRLDPASDAEALRACIVEHQDFHRALEDTWPRGDAIADEYVAYLDSACARQNGCILVAADGADVAGFVCVIASSQGASPDDPAPYAWIQDLFVKSTHRRRGIASLLLDAAAEFAREQGADQLRLGVLDRNADARAFYAAHGFRPYSVILTRGLG